jgi:hypothetical protein
MQSIARIAPLVRQAKANISQVKFLALHAAPPIDVAKVAIRMAIADG